MTRGTTAFTSRAVSPLRLGLLSLLSLLSLARVWAVSFPVDHAIKGYDASGNPGNPASWSAAGSLSIWDGQVDAGAYVASLERLLDASSLPSSPHAMYAVRIDGAVGSIPLACWRRAGLAAGMSLALGADGSVRGVSLTAPCGEGREWGEGREGREGTPLPHVTVSRPQKVVQSTTAFKQQAMLDLDLGASAPTGGSGKGGGEGRAKEAKPDDRTWLQKNWLFLGLAFFIFANKLGQMAQMGEQQQQQRQRGAPGNARGAG